MLYSPGNRPKMIEKAPSYGSDALIFDLEDTVPPDQKAEARTIVAEYLDKFQSDQVMYVRVNGLETGLLQDDLAAVVAPGLAGISVPKVHNPETVRAVAEKLAHWEQVRGLPVGRTELIVSIESARGVVFAYDILSSSPRVTSVSVGVAEDGDLQHDVGYIHSPGGLETLYMRSKVLADARAAGLENPLDGVFARIRDDEGFVAAAQMARRLGYRGKKLIHPRQVELANRVFTPTPQALEYYRRLLEAFDAAVAQGSASTTLDGKLVDYAMAATARRVLQWSDGIGRP